MLEIWYAFNKSSTKNLIYYAALRSFSDLQYTNSLTLPIHTAQCSFLCKQALGHILDKASLSVLESCMMQMEILMKMKALGRIKAYNLVQMFQFMMKRILSEGY